MARSRTEGMTENRRASSSSVRNLISFRLRLALGFWTGGGGRSSSGSRMSSFGGMGSGSSALARNDPTLLAKSDPAPLVNRYELPAGRSPLANGQIQRQLVA